MKTKSDLEGSIRSSHQGDVKKMLEDLIFLGKVNHKVTIDKFTFELKTLTEEENKTIVERLLRIPESQRITCVKSMTLSTSIIKINDLSFDAMAETALEAPFSADDLYIKKNEIILSLQSSVTDKLFKEYESLVLNAKSSIESGEVKN